jgi:hypothetical protein
MLLFMFCIVFCVLNAIFMCMSLNSFVIVLVSFLLYVKVVQFVFRCFASMSESYFCEDVCFLFCL